MPTTEIELHLSQPEVLAASRVCKEGSSIKQPRSFAPNSEKYFGKGTNGAYGNSLHHIMKKTANTPALRLQS